MKKAALMTVLVFLAGGVFAQSAYSTKNAAADPAQELQKVKKEISEVNKQMENLNAKNDSLLRLQRALEQEVSKKTAGDIAKEYPEAAACLGALQNLSDYIVIPRGLTFSYDGIHGPDKCEQLKEEAIILKTPVKGRKIPFSSHETDNNIWNSVKSNEDKYFIPMNSAMEVELKTLKIAKDAGLAFGTAEDRTNKKYLVVEVKGAQKDLALSFARKSGTICYALNGNYDKKVCADILKNSSAAKDSAKEYAKCAGCGGDVAPGAHCQAGSQSGLCSDDPASFGSNSR